MAAKRNSNDIPLSYIIREEDEIEGLLLKTLEGLAREVIIAPLQGIHFECDNFQVYQGLCALLVGGTAETHIDEYANSGKGREAWQKLIMCYEGEDAKTAAIAMAHKNISTATWEHNTRNFTFNNYCTHHIKANNELKKYDVPANGPSQV